MKTVSAGVPVRRGRRRLRRGRPGRSRSRRVGGAVGRRWSGAPVDGGGGVGRGRGVVVAAARQRGSRRHRRASHPARAGGGGRVRGSVESVHRTSLADGAGSSLRIVREQGETGGDGYGAPMSDETPATPFDALQVMASQQVALAPGLRHIEIYTMRGLLTLLWHDPPEDEPSHAAALVLCGGAMGGLLGPAEGMYHRLGVEWAERGVAVVRVSYRRPNDLEACTIDLAAAVQLVNGAGAERVVVDGPQLRRRGRGPRRRRPRSAGRRASSRSPPSPPGARRPPGCAASRCCCSTASATRSCRRRRARWSGCWPAPARSCGCRATATCWRRAATSLWERLEEWLPGPLGLPAVLDLDRTAGRTVARRAVPPLPRARRPAERHRRRIADGRHRADGHALARLPAARGRRRRHVGARWRSGCSSTATCSAPPSWCRTTTSTRTASSRSTPSSRRTRRRRGGRSSRTSPAPATSRPTATATRHACRWCSARGPTGAAGLDLPADYPAADRAALRRVVGAAARAVRPTSTAHRHLWADEDETLTASEAAIARGDVTITEDPALDLAILDVDVGRARRRRPPLRRRLGARAAPDGRPQRDAAPRRRDRPRPPLRRRAALRVVGAAALPPAAAAPRPQPVGRPPAGRGARRRRVDGHAGRQPRATARHAATATAPSSATASSPSSSTTWPPPRRRGTRSRRRREADAPPVRYSGGEDGWRQ